MSARLQLLGMDGAALEKLVVDELGESRFRAKQIAQWLARGAEISAVSYTHLDVYKRPGRKCAGRRWR